MKELNKMKRKDRITGYIARWIVVNIASRINSVAVISLCLEVTRLYEKRTKNNEFYDCI
jgi:hypothetical protein